MTIMSEEEREAVNRHYATIYCKDHLMSAYTSLYDGNMQESLNHFRMAVWAIKEYPDIVRDFRIITGETCPSLLPLIEDIFKS